MAFWVNSCIWDFAIHILKIFFVFWNIKTFLKAFYFQMKTHRYSTQEKKSISYLDITESEFM